MVVPTPDSRQLVPAAAGVAILKLVAHRDAPADAVSLPIKTIIWEPPRDMHLGAAAPHPTPAECYGCVEWFHY